MAFTRRDMSHYALTVAGCTIPYVRCHRSLGIVFDRSMPWTYHIRCLKDKLQSLAHILQTLAGTAWGCSVASLLRLYRALFIGLLRYSLPTLGSLSKSNVKQLEALQAQALRICLGLPKWTSTTGTLCEARCLSARVLLRQENIRVCLRHVSGSFAHPLDDSSRSHVQEFLPVYYQRPIRPELPPCQFSTWSITTTVPGIGKKSAMPPPALTYYTLQNISRCYGGYAHVYADGSVTSESSAIGVWVPPSGASVSQKLSHKTSATKTELAAVRAALQIVRDCPPKP